MRCTAVDTLVPAQQGECPRGREATFQGDKQIFKWLGRSLQENCSQVPTRLSFHGFPAAALWEMDLCTPARVELTLAIRSHTPGLPWKDSNTPGGVHEAACCYQAASGSGLEASLAGHTVLLLIQFSDQRLHESLYYLSLTVSFYCVAQAGLRLKTLFLCLSSAGIIGSGCV